MCGAAKEVGHRVVGGVAIGAGGVIDPPYGVAVRRASSRSRIGAGRGRLGKTGQQLFGWVYWKGSGHEHFVGCLRPDDLLYHPISGQGVSALFQHATKDEERGVGLAGLLRCGGMRPGGWP